MLNYRKFPPLYGMALVVSFGLFAACTDDPVQTSNNMMMEENNRTTPPIGEPPAGSRLEHVSPACNPAEPVCTDDVTFSGGRRLQAKLIDGDGQPVVNTTIKYAITSGDAEGTILEAANVATDDEGVATTNLKAGTDAGSLKISVSTNDPNVQPIEFIISVNPKDAASYNVNFVEVGETDPKKVEVFLYDENTSCESFLSGAPLTAQFNKNGEASANGDLPTVAFAGIPNGTSFTVGAKAFDRTNGDVEISRGCIQASDETRIDAGRPVTVTVPLIKHIPNMVGEYNVVHQFNLTEALPPTFKTIVDLIGVVVSDPGAFIVGCGEEDMNTGELMPTADCPVPTEGIIGLLQDFLPDSGVFGDLKDAIDGFLDSDFVREVARNTINDIVLDFLQNNDNIPDWVGDGISITQDITKSLKNFRVQATLRINSQPEYIVNESGLPEADAEGRLIAQWAEKNNDHIWEDVIIFWRQGCPENAPPECGEAVQIDPNDVSTGDVVEGKWDGTVLDGSSLQINEHSLTLNYGTLLLTVLEKVALPQIFGDPMVNSIEAMLDELIDCQSLAETVAENTVSGAEDIVNTLCGQLKMQASDALRDYVATLVLEGDDRFVIGTPAGVNCQLLGPERYAGEWEGAPLPYVEKIGADPDALCNWDVKIRYSQDSDPVELNGTFYTTTP